MRDRPKVGEILIQAGILDEQQLATALAEQARWGRRLGLTLIKLGLVQEGQLVRALARQFDLPVASLAGKKIAPDVIALVPAKVACEHSVVPLFVKKEGKKELLFLGMEEPSDLGVLDDLAFRTGMAIRPVMVGPSEIGEAIDRYYNAKPPAPVVAPAARLPDPESAADTLSETALRRVPEQEPAPSLSQLLTPAPSAVLERRPIESKPYEAQPFDLPPDPPPPATVVAPPAAPPAAVVAPPPVPPIPPAVAPSSALPSAPAPAPAPAPTSAPQVPRAPAVDAPDVAAPELARLMEETERTRLVAKAIAHLLIEKGLLTLEELSARIDKMKSGRPGPGM